MINLILNTFHQGAPTIIRFLASFADVALKIEKVDPTFSIFNQCPSLPSVATDDREQFQWFNISNNKTGPILFGTLLMRR